MSKAVKVAISLPAEVLEAAEREREARGESRSQFFCHAVEAFRRQARDREAVEQYVRGYQEQPETAEEVAAVHPVSRGLAAQEPWE